MSNNKEPCKFCAFPGGDPSSAQIGYEMIDMGDQEAGQDAPLQVHAIWAALLQLSTNVKDVCFASVEENRTINVKSCRIQSHDTIATIALCLESSQNHISQDFLD